MSTFHTFDWSLRRLLSPCCTTTPPYGLPVSLPPFHRCQYILISLIRSPAVSQKIAPLASTHSPVRRRRKRHLNSVENQGPAAYISPEEKVTSDWLYGTSAQYRRTASWPWSGVENGVSTKTTSGV